MHSCSRQPIHPPLPTPSLGFLSSPGLHQPPSPPFTTLHPHFPSPLLPFISTLSSFFCLSFEHTFYLPLISSLSFKVYLPLPQFVSSFQLHCSLSHKWLPRWGPVSLGRPSWRFEASFQTDRNNPTPIAADLWTAACGLRMLPSPDMSLGAEGTSKGRQI